MASHTFRLAGPDDDELNGYLGAGAVTSIAPDLNVYKYATDIDAGALTDAIGAYKARGWVSVGAGDLRPSVPTFTQTYSTASTTITALPSWSAPGIAASYSAGVLNLTNAASNANLNDLAGKCATLEAELAAHRNEIVALKQNINALVDVLQQRGIAA